ncbi:MAG: SEC-C metal-binding domain-containing protein [Dehalococcoidia bacterium]
MDQALRVLPQASSIVAFHLLDSLRDLRLPESGVEPLEQFLLGQAEPYHKALAAALLLRHGRAPSDDALATLPMDMVVDALPRTEPGFEFVLQRYRIVPEAGEALVYALAQGCNADDLFQLLDGSPREEYRRSLAGLGKQWRFDRSAVLKVKEQGSARRLLREALSAAGESDHLANPGFPLILAQIHSDRERITKLLKVTEEREANGLGAPPGETNLLLACVLALYRDSACLSYLPAKPEVYDLWRCLTQRPWRGREIDQDVAALLGRQDPDTILSGLRRALSSEWAYFTYPFFVLAARGIPGRHEVLEEALRGEYGDGVADEAADAEKLIHRDPEAMEGLLEGWRQTPPSPPLLHILGGYPTEGVVQFLLEHFEAYMSQPYSRYLVETMAEVASPRFLEPLVREWREEEVIMGRTIWLLAELHGMEEDEEIRRIPKGPLDDEQLRDAFRDSESLAEALRQMPTALPLRCTGCSRTYRYKLERVYLGKRAEDTTIGQIVQCKGCGSLETCEITDETLSSLTAELMRLNVLADLQPDGGKADTFIMQQPLAITAAGKSFRSLSEAYQFLLKAVEREPEKAELHRRLGSILRNGLRPDLALPYYREAVRLDPKDIEAVHCLADVLLNQAHYQEAISYTEALVSLCRDPGLDEGLCREFFGSLLALAREIEEKTGHRIALFPPPEEHPERQQGGEDGAILELFTLDLANPRELEQAYQLFRHGSPPKGLLDQGWRRSETDSWQPAPTEPFRGRKAGRNEPCPCGSGKKYKRCCGRR